MPQGRGLPGNAQERATRRAVINLKAITITFVAGGTLTISGGLAAAGFFDGSDPTDSPSAVADRFGVSLQDGALVLPPAAPLDPTATQTPSSSTANSGAIEATATRTPVNNAPVATATNPPPTATQPPPTPTTAPPTQVPTQAPTQVPPTQVPPTQPPAPTQAPPAPTATTPPPPPQSTSLHAMEAEMFQSHNQQRAANGIGALAIDAQLVDIARQRSQTMANTTCFSHTACGPTAFDLMGSVGYFYQIAGENIARNNYSNAQTVQVAMNGFMNSPGHRANILDGRYTKVGIGVAFGANDMKYFTVIFAGP